MEVCVKLREHAKETEGVESMILRAYSDALELIPFTLAENAGLNPINIVTELRNRHLKGDK
jgi:T-complex protein 1 subunit delta